MRCPVFVVLSLGGCAVLCRAAGPTLGKRALLIVDLQEDYRTGDVRISDPDGVVHRIDALRRQPLFDQTVWINTAHPEDHVSFASSHGLPVGTQISVSGAAYNHQAGVASKVQVETDKFGSVNPSLKDNIALEAYPGTAVPRNITLTPRHSIAHTIGAKLMLTPYTGEPVVTRGQLRGVASLSGFGEYPEITPLDAILRSSGVGIVYIVGSSLERGVQATAHAAALRGYRVIVVEDACGLVNPSEARAVKGNLGAMGVAFVPAIQVRAVDGPTDSLAPIQVPIPVESLESATVIEIPVLPVPEIPIAGLY